MRSTSAITTSPDGTVTDDDLARAFEARAPGAFEEAYRRYADVLLAVARHVEAQDARDCVHDALLRVWSTPGTYRVARGALRAFLIVCVRNHALTQRREDARHRAIELRAVRGAPETYAFEPADHLEAARIRAALRALPAEQRTVVELAYFENKTQTQIAAQLATPLGTVKSRAVLALRKLALALDTDTR